MDGIRAARWSATVSAPRKHCFPALCAFSSPDRGTKRRLRFAGGETARGGNAAARRRSPGNGQNDRAGKRQTLPHQRRAATACGAGSRAGKPASTALARRASIGAGRKSPPANAGRIEIASARGRNRICIRHPRPGRSHGHVGPHRAAAIRRTGTGRHTSRDLFPSRDLLCSPVHRPHQFAEG